MPRKPLTERATSSAACGGQTDRITSACPAISLAAPTSRIPAAAARSAVAGLRPADAHSTVSPRWVRQAPTAAPISPGCSTPIRFLSTIASGTSLTHVPRPGLPGRPGARSRPWRPRERGELVPPLHAELDLVARRVGAARVLRWQPRNMGQDDQRAARGVRPQHVLDLPWVHPRDGPAAEGLHHLPRGGGELGEGQFAGQWVLGQVLGGSDDLAAVRGDDGAETEEDVADLPVHVVPGCPVARP